MTLPTIHILQLQQFDVPTFVCQRWPPRWLHQRPADQSPNRDGQQKEQEQRHQALSDQEPHVDICQLSDRKPHLWLADQREHDPPNEELRLQVRAQGRVRQESVQEWAARQDPHLDGIQGEDGLGEGIIDLFGLNC